MPREVREVEGSGVALALGVATRQDAAQFLSRVAGECRSCKNDIMYIIGELNAVLCLPGLTVVGRLAFKEDRSGNVG